MKKLLRSTPLALVPLCAALVLAACEGTDPPLAPLDGEGILFSYGGAAAGSYRSAGNVTVGANGLPGFGKWAVSHPDSLGGIVVAGLEPTGGTRGNLFVLQLRRKGTGEYECAYLGAGGGGCYGTFIVGIDLGDPARPGEYYFIDTGRVSVTSLADRRIRGSFEVGLHALSDPSNPAKRITVSEGRIDVPFREDLSLETLRCLVESAHTGKSQGC